LHAHPGSKRASDVVPRVISRPGVRARTP
jgi:hypothetical protein